MKIKTNIDVIKYLEPYQKNWKVSIGFCDRMFLVVLNIDDEESKNIVDFLKDNFFFRHEKTNVYYRLKSKIGEHTTPSNFDTENQNIRYEMVSKMNNN